MMTKCVVNVPQIPTFRIRVPVAIQKLMIKPDTQKRRPDLAFLFILPLYLPLGPRMRPAKRVFLQFWYEFDSDADLAS
jgi:hypothetical protein